MKALRATFLCAVVVGELSVSLSGFSQTIPKQAKLEATYDVEAQIIMDIDAGNHQSLRLYHASLEFRNGSNPPLFRNISASCVESAFTAAGESGYCVYIDRDGDKFVETITRPAGEKVGHGVFGSGTGKYVGITGEVSWETLARPASQHGTFSFHGKMTGNYKLP